MKKVLFVDTTHPYLMEGLEKAGFQCDAFSGYKRADFLNIIHEYEGVIIRSKIKMDEEILSKAEKLQFIGRVGAGMENIDVDFAQRRNIECLNAPEGNRNAVGEQAVGMLLMLMNHLRRADAEVRQGIWKREENRGLELEGKTVGIIGYGNTGGAFARKLSGFDVNILAYDKYKTGFSDAYAREASMDELYEQCDIVSLHLPLTDETRFLVTDEFINRFKKSFFLVNTARGKIVHTADLVKNLKSGTVRGACLDVLEFEGLSFEHLEASQLPRAFTDLIEMDQVVLSPHIAGWTHESNWKLAHTLVEKIKTLYGIQD
ncbi:MAG: 2-hydroxyacid dehydrogenase [Bacteroidales bacterium]|nr:2-hydroxyacid dehydrogenase [Bacteroidales bacterium]